MRPSRSGFTLIESCAAAALLAAALAIAASLLSSVARQRRSATLHATAAIAADNLLERITGESFAAITPELAGELGQRSNIADLLPDGAVEITVNPVVGPPPGKRIEVELTWRTSGSGPPARHAIATWVFQAKEK